MYFYGIYEVYYNEDGSIWATTENPVGLGVDRYVELGDTEDWAVDEIRGGLDKMLKATYHPILDLDTVVFTPRPDEEEE